MFKRLRDGLFSPTSVVNYKDDSWWITLLFFLLLGLFSAIPSIIFSTSSFELDYAQQIAIRNEFKLEDVPFEIVNFQLINKEDEASFVYKKTLFEAYQIIISEDVMELPTLFNSTPTIYLTKTGVHYYQSTTIHRELLRYEDYSTLENVDLSLVAMNDVEVWNAIFEVVKEEMIPFEPLYLSLSITSAIVFALLKLLGFSLLITVLQKLTASSVPFAALYKCIIYVMCNFCCCKVFVSI